VGGAALMAGDRAAGPAAEAGRDLRPAGSPDSRAAADRAAGDGDLRAKEDRELLPREFFNGSAVDVAPKLLGCVLAHQTTEGLVEVVLTEVEAYAGAADPASHAFRGRTTRNAVMFGAPGHAYVYFTYGMHFCVNLVCSPAGEASAVLLRAGRVIEGVGLAASRRQGRPGAATKPAPAGAAGSAAAGAAGSAAAGAAGSAAAGAAGSALSAAARRDLARGPARLCQALGIDRSLDGADVCDPASPLRVGPARAAVARARICRGPRVGVSSAADVAWRFWIAGEPTVSPYRPHVPRHASAKAVSLGEAADGTMPG
jgi:DNA-3-methyladenine glycosylase